MKVKHKNGALACSCDCKTYLCHWENYAGKKAKKCYKSGCSNTTNLVGAHVYKCNSEDLTQWIIPLCSGCNTDGNTDCFDLDNDYFLVAVSNRKKCEKCD